LGCFYQKDLSKIAVISSVPTVGQFPFPCVN
jgi:hypothetical protein